MERLDGVQGLRAVAAWLVVVAHGALWAMPNGSPGMSVRAYEMLGSLGVMMFFTVSGFIMVFIGRDSFGVRGGAAVFLRRRLIRIVPLYWLMTFLAAAIVVRKGEGVPLEHLVQSMLFIPYSSGGPFMRPVLGVGWTLNYEMFFYVLFASALFLRRGLAVLCGTIAALLVLGQVMNPVWSFRDHDTAIGMWTDPLLLLFLLGIGLAVLRDALPGLRAKRPFICIAVGIALVLVMQESFVAEGSYPPVWRLVVLLSGAAIASFAILSPGNLKVPRWLVLFGDASYSLYLVHPLLFGVVARLGGDALVAVSPAAALLLFFSISSAAGLALHLFVERPVTRWLSRRLASPRPKAVPVEKRDHPIDIAESVT